ncbi:hypothetical protein VTN77DRAFT_4119 [Rasamsonia byssochlamydoides]|uniref:uncharacterized protein n=1 Tax=Rasamsonia byssochlamydoides TaxID=89139 RepID=UPI0037441509
MPQSPREKGRGTGGRAAEEEFVLYLQGIPAHCRWQELKDFIRQSALHIRQAVVYDDQQGYPTGLGQIIVKNEDEAWRTYQRLSTNGWEGQTLTVTLARASSPTRPIAGPTRSPTCFPQPSYARRYSRSATSITAPASPISSASMTTPPASYQSPEPIMIVNCMAVNNVMPLPMDPVFQPVPWDATAAKGVAPIPAPPAPMFSPPFKPIAFPFYPYQMPAVHPMYEIPVPKPPAYNSCRTNMYHQYYHSYSYGYEMHSNSINMAAHASFPTYPTTGSRSVLVHNLSPDINQQILAGHFRVAGLVQRCEIMPQHEDGSGRKGSFYYYATVTFGTEEEAKRAVDLCDRSLLMGRRIRVRQDWDAGSPTSNPSDVSESALTLSPSSSLSASSSKAETADSKANANASHNHTDSRRDSGKEFSIQNDKSNATAATAAPPHHPLVVNGSSVRVR